MAENEARVSGAAPAPARPAATVVVLRDGAAGLEVLLVERHRGIDFAGGATAFPGGKVDPADVAPEARARCRGVATLAPAAAALRVAALRELFEESGMLLARPRGRSELLDGARAASIARGAGDARRRGHVAIGALAVREDLELAGDLLVPFAHWITPEFLPKRFDTHFFVVAAPPGQDVLHDGGETVAWRWMAPRTALEQADSGKRTMMFPTRLNLAWLARSARVQEALAAARARPIVPVMPRLERVDGRPVMRIPPEAGYDVVEAPLDALVRRRR